MIGFCTFIIAAVVILYGAWATAANYGNQCGMYPNRIYSV